MINILANKAYRQLRFRRSSFFLFLITSISASLTRAEPNLEERAIERTRYASGVQSILVSHQYFQKNKAQLYWRISPYYLPQLTDSSCSLASATMIVNAARSHQKLAANEPLATQDELLIRVNDEVWRQGVKQGGDGVSLAQLKRLMAKALETYGVQNFTIDLIQLKNNSKENELALRKTLIESEETGGTFIIANFNQKFFTGDTSVGHFSPIGAYDGTAKRVLIMDPDRQLYEPYWVPEKLLLTSMSTLDKEAGHHRGYLIIRLKSAK